MDDCIIKKLLKSRIMKNWYIKSLKREKEAKDTLGKEVNPEIKNGCRTIFPPITLFEEPKFLNNPFQKLAK